jgi:branched-chain amino acid transport system substrate-binding protein
MAGLTGATIGLGAGLGGLVAACGGSEPATTTAGPTTTAGATTTTAGATTTVSTGADSGRAIKLGVVSPKTGNFANFAIADDWWIGRGREVLKDGIVTGDGKLRQVELVVKDTQSDANRASQVSADLVQLDKVDMLLASGTPDTCNPVSAQGEALGCPTLNTLSPWQALFLGQDGKPVEFKWVFGNMIGSEQTIACFIEMFEQVQTNKKVGMLFANDADTMGWMAPFAAPKVLAEKGYTLVVPDYYQPPGEDFTKQIAMFKQEGCEIVCGTNDPPWFSNFWTQCFQQGYQPKCCSSGKALLFPQAVESLPNNIGDGLIGEVGWHPSWKIKDTLSDLDSEGLAADYEAKTGLQWTAAIGAYGKLEWAVDVYRRATDPEDKETVLAAIKTTRGTFQQGDIDFTEPVDPEGFHPLPNIYKAWMAAGQWRKGTEYPFDVVVCSTATAPGAPVQDTARPMVYS